MRSDCLSSGSQSGPHLKKIVKEEGFQKDARCHFHTGYHDCPQISFRLIVAVQSFDIHGRWNNCRWRSTGQRSFATL